MTNSKNDSNSENIISLLGITSLQKQDLTFTDIKDFLMISKNAKVQCHFKSGQTIFYAGNSPLGIFTIQKGLVKLETTSQSGNSHTLRLKSAGDILGYRSLFANENYQATAVAVDDCELCFISKADIFAAIAKNPETTLKLLEHMAKDLRRAEEKWIRQMDQGAAERIAEALLYLQDHFNPTHWTRREIAQWAGTTPETVIRTLSQFEKEGLIDQTDGRNIRILSKEKLVKRTSSTRI